MAAGFSWRRFVSACLLVVGACIGTYAWARQATTRLVLERAESRTRTFLEEHNLIYGDHNADIEIPEDTYLASRTLLGQIGTAGGMHYWWNDALPYFGAGVLLFCAGVLLPFVERRRAKPGSP